MTDGARVRAIDSLVNSTFLQGGEGGGLNYLFKDMDQRRPIAEAEQLLEVLDANDIGAAVVSIMQAEHAEWVGGAHRRFPRKILPAMIVDPTKGMTEVRRVVEYHERYGVRCLRIPPFRYTLPPTDRVYKRTCPDGRDVRAFRFSTVGAMSPGAMYRAPTELASRRGAIHCARRMARRGSRQSYIERPWPGRRTD